MRKDFQIGRRGRLGLILVTATLAVPFVAEPQQELVRYESSHRAMGTTFTVAAYGRDRELLAEATDEVFDEIDRLDGQMSNYRPESELSEINRTAARGPVLVEPRLFNLISESIRYSDETGGAFDATVGPLMEAWGFFPAPRFDAHGRRHVPEQAELRAALSRVGYHHLRLDPAGRTLSFDRSGVELDLGGIAKGYAVDRAAEILKENGAEAALISSGTSSLYALGAPPGERGWRVTVRDPYHASKRADNFLLKNYSLSVSGSYEKFFTVGGKTFAHIMDPRTGRPVEGVLQTVVMAGRGTASDALSTAFFVMGVESSRRYVASHGNLRAVLYTPERAPGRYKRSVLSSSEFGLPVECLAELE